MVYDRAPPLPLQCFHGNCFADSIDIINKDGKVYGLKCFLVAEGKEINNIYIFYYCLWRSLLGSENCRVGLGERVGNNVERKAI